MRMPDCISSLMWPASTRLFVAVRTCMRVTIDEYLTPPRSGEGQSSRTSSTGCGRCLVPIPTEGMGTSFTNGRTIRLFRMCRAPMMRGPQQFCQLLLLVEAAAPQQAVAPPVGLGWLGQQLAQLVQPPQPLHLLHLLPVPAPAPEGAASVL